MSLIIPPGFGSCSVILVGPDGTQPYMTSMGIDLSTAAGDFVGAANTVVSAYAEAFMPLTNDTLTLVGSILAVGQDGGDAPTISSAPVSVPGGEAAAMAPTAMSIIMQKGTNVLGRRGRGRMFIPGAAQEPAIEANGEIASGSVDAYAAAGITFLELLNEPTELGLPSTPPVLLHSVAPADPTPVISLSPAPLVGWVRGRIR